MNVDGEDCKIIDRLGYRHEAMGYVYEVETADGSRKMAVGSAGRYRFWKAEDRLRAGCNSKGQPDVQP